jgi:hypothetical protein
VSAFHIRSCFVQLKSFTCNADDGSTRAFPAPVTGTRRMAKLLVLATLTVAVRATTLEQLSLDDMIEKSTSVVRGRITGTYTEARNNNIYTYYRVALLEQWKGNVAAQLDVAVPGGALRGVRQTLPGAPTLREGDEYVLFLWTGRSGITQVIGLSQGLFSVKVDAAGNPVLARPAATELMVDRNGRLVVDQPLTMRVSDMRSRVRAASGASR